MQVVYKPCFLPITLPQYYVQIQLEKAKLNEENGCVVGAETFTVETFEKV